MRPFWRALLIIMIPIAGSLVASAQQSQYDLVPGATPKERLPPGMHSPYDGQRGGAVIGGRPGSLRPRVPMHASPRTPEQVAPSLQMPQEPPAEPESLPLPDAGSILFEIEDEGPPAGLTLEQAIDRLVRASIVLRAKSMDIPQARADVLTAGLHANPVVYFDGQLLPYRAYNAVTNPGGPAQYDLNVAYPLDLSGKRQARINVANAARRVVEALYQDAVRQEIDRLGTVYIDALAARLAVRSIKNGLARVDRVLRQVEKQQKDPQETAALLHRLAIQRHTIVLALIDAEAVWKNSKRTLTVLMNLPAEELANLDLRGTIEDNAPDPPTLSALVSSALANRPDLVAYRLGLQRAVADVNLAKANALPDVYALYQPFTYQDNTPFNAPSSRSWAAGATVTVPLFDRNQGNIRRAKVNVEQSRLELQALERRVAAEVETVFDEYHATQRGIDQLARELLPDAERTRGQNLKEFNEGKLDASWYLTAQRELDDLGRQYRDLLVRHRRSMLGLNTAVGMRVLP